MARALVTVTPAAQTLGEIRQIGRDPRRRIGCRSGPRAGNAPAPRLLRLIALAGLAGTLLLAACGHPPHGHQARAQNRIPGRPGSGRLIAEGALSYIGTPYRRGGSDSRGVDCSGLVHRIFLDQGFVLPRTAAEQARHGMPISPRDLAAGDVVFFRTSGNKTSHVGIYVGDGRFVHAPGTGDRVKVSRLDSSYFQPRYVGARRMVRK